MTSQELKTDVNMTEDSVPLEKPELKRQTGATQVQKPKKPLTEARRTISKSKSSDAKECS